MVRPPVRVDRGNHPRHGHPYRRMRPDPCRPDRPRPMRPTETTSSRQRSWQVGRVFGPRPRSRSWPRPGPSNQTRRMKSSSPICTRRVARTTPRSKLSCRDVVVDDLAGEKSLVRAYESGSEGTRTPNPRLAKAVLCQLSYAPGRGAGRSRRRGCYRRSGAVVASCHRARSSFAALTFLATSAAAPTTPTTMSSFFHMGRTPSESMWAGARVGLDGIEPSTSELSALRSNRLSYSPPYQVALSAKDRRDE